MFRYFCQNGFEEFVGRLQMRMPGVLRNTPTCVSVALTAMTRAQRIVAVLYCLLVVYCAVWVPWVANTKNIKDIHQGYGWVWSPPWESQAYPQSPHAYWLRPLSVGLPFYSPRNGKCCYLLEFLASAGILLYRFGADKLAEHQAQRVHDCAVAKVARAKCTPSVPSRRRKGKLICLLVL